MRPLCGHFCTAVFVFDEDLVTWRELLSMLLFPPSKLRNSKCRAVVESGECWFASGDPFSESGPATLVGEVIGLEEVLVLEIAWMAFLYLTSVALIFLAQEK